MRTRAAFIEASLDLAWSHWTGLGVRGNVRPPETAVDPEALLYFTAALGDADPRLTAEVGDWWKRFRGWLSQSRLSALARSFDKSTVERFRAMTDGFTARRSTGKSNLEHVDLPARSLLRLRCAFGASARAEVLHELLTLPYRETGATALALSQTGYSKRNVALVLEELVLAGLVVATREGNRATYRVADPNTLDMLLRLPQASGRWHLRLPIAATFLELFARPEGDAVVQGIEARKLLARLQPRLSAAGIRARLPTASIETFATSLQYWLAETLFGEQARHRDPERRIEGVWLTDGRDLPRPDRFGSAVLPRIGADPLDDELVCLDLVQLPTIDPPDDWTWGVLSTAATNIYSHTTALDRHQPVDFATWSTGERRDYSVTYEKPVPHADIERLYGREAAERSRADRPAVQLRLTVRDSSGSRRSGRRTSRRRD